MTMTMEVVRLSRTADMKKVIVAMTNNNFRLLLVVMRLVMNINPP